MPHPPKNVVVPFDLLFPMLVFYFAQLKDKEVGGEFSLDCSWKQVCSAIDMQRSISLSKAQFDSLLYSYKVGVMDRRKPFRIISYVAKNYIPFLKELRKALPHIFKEDRDGEILLHGEGFPG